MLLFGSSGGEDGEGEGGAGRGGTVEWGAWRGPSEMPLDIVVISWSYVSLMCLLGRYKGREIRILMWSSNGDVNDTSYALIECAS